MKEALIQLLKVKSLMSLIATAVFAYMAIIGTLDAKDVFAVILMVYAFFFSKQDKV